MLNYDNPATRLFAVLEQGRRVTHSENCRAVWVKILGTSEPVALARRLADTRALIGESVDLATRLAPRYRPIEHWIKQTNTAFDRMHLDGQWGSFIAHIDSHAMDHLETLTHLLDAKLPDSAMSEDIVLNFRTEIDELLVEILRADLDSELRMYLVRSLGKIINALDEYKLTGSAAILDAVQTAVGGVVIDVELQSKARESTLAKKALSAIARTATAFSTVKGVAESIEYVIKLLE